MSEPVAILEIKLERSDASDVRATILGSGFLLKPKHVLTCNHVLERVRRHGHLNFAIATLGGEAFVFAATDILASDDSLDLALVRLANFPLSSGSLQLAADLPSSDRMYVLRAYSSEGIFIQGSTGRGVEYGRRWFVNVRDAFSEVTCLVDKTTQGVRTEICCITETKTRGGMSGAPLVDSVTGHVVGVHAMGPQSAHDWDRRAVAISVVHVTQLLNRLCR